MDPLITNGIDPALLRVLDKRGQERDSPLRRRRTPPADAPVEEGKQEEEKPEAAEPDPDAPKHKLDDLA